MLRWEATIIGLERTAELPSIERLIGILNKVRKIKNQGYAKRLHAYICNNGLEGHEAFGNYMVPMLVDCGAIFDAHQVFHRFLHRNEHSWTFLISGYIEYGQFHQSFNLFQAMQIENVLPSSYTFVALLKACSRLKDMERGREIHAEIALRGLDLEPFVASRLVDMYAKCGLISEARATFDRLPTRDVVLWTALISGYVDYGACQEALTCFKQMQLQGISPNSVTYVCTLKACGSIGAINTGREIHAKIVEKGLERDIFVGNTLVSMYAKCGSLSEALEVLHKLPVRDVVSWAALIAGYAEYGPCRQALECFEEMQLEGISPDPVIFVSVLKACGSVGAIEKGQDIHNKIVQKGFEQDLFVANALVDMYAKCGSLSAAQDVFDKMPVRNVVSWTALVSGYAEHGPGQEALLCFKKMQLEGVSPNAFTYVCCLKACGSVAEIEMGRELHAEIKQKGFEGDALVGGALIDMYAKYGSLSEAHEVFDSLPVRCDVSWTALIAGYAEHGPGQEALKCFEEMMLEGISVDTITFVSVLKACASLGAIDKGREIHAEIIQKGFESDPFICSILIDMYVKCGLIVEGRKVFDKLPVQDVASWNAMINGYGMNDEGNMAICCFEEMHKQSVKPNAITFTCLLTACSRATMVIKGQEYFKMMREKYGIVPTLDHLTCMVDLLARAGHLCEAENFIETMPCSPSIETWTALLTGCKMYGNLRTGWRCFERLVQMNPKYVTSYMFMASIYANAGRRDDANRIEELRKLAGAKKKACNRFNRSKQEGP